MELNDYDVWLKEVIDRYKGFSPRRHHPIEGLPGNPRARHTCKDCHRKKYEENMKITGLVKENNWKAWMLWRCKNCDEE